jgi:cytochrome c2
MPATEKTRIDTKVLNLVFGIASIGLFLSTLWLLAADHSRKWKDYQRKFQEIENWTLVSRDNEQQTENYTLAENALQAAVDRAILTPPSQTEVDAFIGQTATFDGVERVESQVAALKSAYAALSAELAGLDLPHEDNAQLHKHAGTIAAQRENLFAEMAAVIAAVKFVEDGGATKRKFRRADLDAAKSKYDLAVRDGLSAEEKRRLRDAIALVEADVADLTIAYEAANEHRKALERIRKELQADETAAHKQLTEFRSTRDQLQRSLAEKTAFGRGFLELPIVDAFGRPLQIDQIWLPTLTLNNNFRDVARFDRCVTCHQGIDTTAPGSATEPGYRGHQPVRSLTLETPAALPSGSETDGPTTQSLYGFQLSKHGLIRPSDVLVEFVWPRSAAAVAGLEPGDVITHIRVGGRNEKLVGNADALRYLTRQVPWGQPLELTVRRGYPQPYSSHPRLDLFVGSMSPHKKQEMGCTICHQGQGSATDFKWASHTPNDPREAERWRKEYGWFDNHHWALPMQPERFLESSCLKCHHQVTDLEPSERFPEPPAPKLMEGYRLVQYYGCFGCHEVNGYDGPDHRIGPDLRSEPNYFAAAQQVAFLLDQLSPKKEHALDAAAAASSEMAELTLPAIRSLAEEVSYNPDDAMKRRQLLGILEEESGRQYAAEELLVDPRLTSTEARQWAQAVRDNPTDSAPREKLIVWIEEDREKSNPELSVDSHNLIPSLKQAPLVPSGVLPMVNLLKDVAAPGTMRRVGPSLRYVGSKLGLKTLAAWIKRPQDIRPTSKMPAFFGLHDHLKDDPEIVSDTAAWEDIEIRAAAHYLHTRSQPFAYAPPQKIVTESPSAERGKIQFEIRGCLACHSHEGTPAGEAMQGPNLSDLAKKINTEKGKKWLRSWLLHPSRYHRRTKMPVMYLDPEPLLDETGARQTAADGTVKMSDPAADMAAYLLGADWQPTENTLPPLSAAQLKVLDALAMDYLKSAFAEKRAEVYLRDGIPTQLAATLKGAEVELLGSADESHRLLYVGRRTISKYGCAGCHDIPGLEAEKPIGVALADWGRKDPSKIAFEHIVHYIEKKQAHDAPADSSHGQEGHPQDQEGHPQDIEATHAAEHGIDLAALPSDEGYFTAAIMHHSREGFLRQKLLEPRSYDYEKVKNKGYNDRLRMPQFPWAAGVMESDARKQKRDAEIEAIMTFVLGLVAEPPGSEYVYQPDTRRDAIIQGEKVLAKFNCAGCHTLELGRWDLAYRPGDFGGSDPVPVYPFLEPSYSTEEIQNSENADWQGLLHSSLRGMERVDADGHPEQMVYDPEEEDYVSLEEYRDAYESKPPPGSQGHSVDLWKPTYLDGHPYVVKDPLRTIPEQMVTRHYPPRGGDFARLLLPIAVELVRKTEPTADGTAAMAWVPPPLVGQGNKTQEAWLAEFLLNPYPIRPGVLLRMPKFNLSRADAESLVQYFSARDNPDYPQQFVASRNRADLEDAASAYQQRMVAAGESDSRLDDALKIVINKAGCIACHAVNDQRPEGGDRGNGPNLADVHERLQPAYMKRWIAKPSWILPYTKMQELLPYKPDDPPTYGGFELPVLNPQGQPVVGADGKPKLVELYHGTGSEQLQAIVDLLANFGSYLESKTSIQERAQQLERQLGGGSVNQQQSANRR